MLPAQCGEHGQSRETYGHSLVGGPWGVDLANGGEEAGSIILDIHPGLIRGARPKMTSLHNDQQ